MNFKSIYDPKHVYEGFFETYFIRPFVHRYADFNGEERGKSISYSLLAWLIITLGLIGLMLGLVGLLGPEVGFTTLYIGGGIWIAASIIPILALFSRRGVEEPDAGNGRKQKLMLPIDMVLAAISVLFFFLGLLMMISTLNSEELTADPGTMEEDTTTLEFDEVVEEPIFTYQDEVAETPAQDTLMDLEDPEAMTPDESFDPTLGTDSI
jgi:uncharacterized membrane protein YhaH (DUF805 family)